MFAKMVQLVLINLAAVTHASVLTAGRAKIVPKTLTIVHRPPARTGPHVTTGWAISIASVRQAKLASCVSSTMAATTTRATQMQHATRRQSTDGPFARAHRALVGQIVPLTTMNAPPVHHANMVARVSICPVRFVASVLAVLLARVARSTLTSARRTRA